MSHNDRRDSTAHGIVGLVVVLGSMLLATLLFLEAVRPPDSLFADPYPPDKPETPAE